MAQSSRRSRSERAKTEPCVNGWILARYKISFLMMFPGKDQKQADSKGISYQDDADLWLQSLRLLSHRCQLATPFPVSEVAYKDCLPLGLDWTTGSSHYLRQTFLSSTSTSQSMITHMKTVHSSI